MLLLETMCVISPGQSHEAVGGLDGFGDHQFPEILLVSMGGKNHRTRTHKFWLNHNLMEYTIYREIHFFNVSKYIFNSLSRFFMQKRIWMRYIAAAFESSVKHYKLGYWQSISP